MFFYLLLAFVGIPLIEIALFIEIGGAIGTVATIAIVIATAVLGASLLRQQGMSTARMAQTKLSRGEMPVEQAFDGMFLVFAGGLLLTPGFMTDAIGFSLFVPQIRGWLRGRLISAAKKRGAFEVYSTGAAASTATGTAHAHESDMWRDPTPQRGDSGKGPAIDRNATDIEATDIESGDPDNTPTPPRDDSPWRDR
ncbi:FxsA family protein [Pyruvatibacter sp.]|uniref:FxsA family protein n=1 Tax=Pyruvatibacter sp. TaxID=1981328 RepID=UPI0032EC89C1